MFLQRFFGNTLSSVNLGRGVVIGGDQEHVDIDDIAADASVFINDKQVKSAAPVKMMSINRGRIFVNGVDVSQEYPASATAPLQVKIEIKGNVGGSVNTVSGDITVTGDIRGSAGAQSVSGNVEVEGNVAGSASSVSGNVQVGGNVSGSASSTSGSVRVAGKKQKREH